MTLEKYNPLIEILRSEGLPVTIETFVQAHREVITGLSVSAPGLALVARKRRIERLMVGYNVRVNLDGNLEKIGIELK